MVGCGRGCQLPVQSTVADYRESLMAQCVAHVSAIVHTKWHMVHRSHLEVVRSCTGSQICIEHKSICGH